jgi:hypothetical protein
VLVCAPAIKQEKHAGCKIHGTMLINSSGNIRFACAVFDKMLLGYLFSSDMRSALDKLN